MTSSMRSTGLPFIRQKLPLRKPSRHFRIEPVSDGFEIEILPVIGSFLLPVLGRMSAALRNAAALLFVLISVIGSFLLIPRVMGGQSILINIPLSMGINIVFQADMLAVFEQVADIRNHHIHAEQLGFRKIAAFTLDSDGKNLYVLDPGSNAIWVYTGTFGQFSNLPVMFFGQQVPQNMGSAITMAVNNADLYLLFQDGHVTICPLTRLSVSPVRCSDPATFKDSRPERQSGPKINDAIFSQMTFASAPDPSLYLLEPLTRAIYRFSPRSDSLELRGQFRATMEAEQYNPLFDGPATAMTIGPNRFIFFSVGDQVFFATDVP